MLVDNHYEIRRNRSKGVNLILPIVGVFLGLFGLGDIGVHRFEKEAAAKIREKLGDSKASISVRTGLDLGLLQGDIRAVVIRGHGFKASGLPLFTEPDRPQDGKLRILRLDLRDFSLRGLHMDRLEASIPDCRFDLGLAMRKHEIRLSRSGTGAGSVTIRDHDLESFVLSKFHDIKRATIRISNGRLHVAGHGQFLIFDTDFTVDARVVIQDGTKLALEDATILFDGQPTDDLSRKALLATLNPVVDLNADLQLYDAIRVTQVSLGEGVLTASGPTSIPVKG